MTGFVILFLVFTLIRSSTSLCHTTEGVGTVLFTESDNTKDCWSTESIALLTSRMILEDILPSKDVLIIRDNCFIVDIIDYFRLVLETVRRVTYGKTKHVMLLALTDTLGGYFNHYLIPIAKHAFYSGYIDFDNMQKLYQLFNELKCFLRTNGHGWNEPVREFSRKIQAKPLPVQVPSPKTDPCMGLVIYDNSDTAGDRGNRGGIGGVSSERAGARPCFVGIPMPFLDSKTKPSAIAVPFKTYSLRSVESKSASYILVKFYMAATKCLVSRNADKKSIDDFNNNYYAWIRHQVLPHLKDEKFFAAFGGVLRVRETLLMMGAAKFNHKEIGNYNIMPEVQAKEEMKEISEEEVTKHKKSNLILMALLATIFIWFLLGSMFICYRIKTAKGRRDCKCGTPEKKSLSSMPSSKMSKSSSKSSKRSCRVPNTCVDMKKAGTTSRSSRSKSKTTSSGKVSGARSTGSVCSAGSGASGNSDRSIRSSVSGVSARSGSLPSGCSCGSNRSNRSNKSNRSPKSPTKGVSPNASVLSKGSTSSGASVKSSSSKLSRRSYNKQSKTTGRSSPGGGSMVSQRSKASKRSCLPSKNSSKSSGVSKRSNAMKPLRLYPASCACHTSMTGKYRMTSSSDVQMRMGLQQQQHPLILGYELETSSSGRSTPTGATPGLDDFEVPPK